MKDINPKMQIKVSKKGLLYFVGFIVAGIVIYKSTYIIPAGYEGVVYNPLKQGVQENVLSQGLQFANPLATVTKYTIATEQQFLSADNREGSETDESFNIVTSDGKSVRVSLEYSLRFEAGETPKVFTRFRGKSGKEVFGTYVRGKIKTYTSEASSKYSVMDLYGSKRQEINASIFKHVKQQFAKDYIIVDSVNLTDVQVDEETKNAIQQRVTAQQELEKEKIERDKAIIVSEKLKIEAEGRANAQAREILIKADAEAKANNIISASITDKVLELKRIEKWNGQKENTTLVNGGTAIVGNK